MRKLLSRLALCTLAILAVAMCGCEDLGEYADTEEYYDTFGDIVLINGTTKERINCSVADSFYNEESRENFLEGSDKRVKHADYVYIAIPFESSIDMDSLALYMQSKNDATVYINVFVTDEIPSDWKSIADNESNSGGSDKGTEASSEANEDETKKYDDPSPDTRVAETTVHLKSGKWSSFVVDAFNIGGQIQKSIQIDDGQYVLLQIRNNSGVRVFDKSKGIYVDEQTGLELQKAEITMTNLLVRSLDTTKGEKRQGGE